MHDLLRPLLDRANFARAGVEQWSDTSTDGDPARIDRLVDAMLGDSTILR